MPSARGSGGPVRARRAPGPDPRAPRPAAGPRGSGRPSGRPKLQRAVGPALDLVALLVHRAVMAATEQREVRERGRAALRPVTEVMALAERGRRSPGSGSPGPDGGARAATPAESSGSGPRPRRCAPPRRAASPPGSHRTPGAATFPRERGPLLEHGLAGLRPDPPAPRRRHGPPPGTARPARRDRARGGGPLSASRASASACCCARRRRRGGPAIWRDARPLVQRLARRVQRPHEQGARLGLQPPAEHHHAVLVLVDVERSGPRAAASRLRASAFGPRAASPARSARRGRPCPPRPTAEQPRLGLRRGDAGQGPDLGVGELPAGEGLRPAGAACPGRAPRGPAPGPRPGRARPARLSQSAQERKPVFHPPGRRTRG